MWTNFNNSFTVVFVDELQKKTVLDPPLHVPCKKLNVQLCIFTVRYLLQIWRRIVCFFQYLSTRDARFDFLCLRRL